MKWTLPSTAGNPVIGTNGSIYVAAQDLYAINPDGSQQWKRLQAGQSGLIALGADGTIYTTGSNYPEGYQQGLLALRPDGSLKWINSDFPNYYSNNDLTVGTDRTIYWNHRNSVLAVNPDGSTKINLNTGGENFVNGADGSHFVGTGSSILSVNDTGNTNWTFGLGRHVLAVAVDGTIYTESDNNLIAVNSSSLGLANSSWASARHDNQNTARATQSTKPQRFVRVKGTVSKLYQINAPLAGYMVAVTRDNGDPFCQTTTLTNGSFLCGAPVTDLNAFDTHIQATGSENGYAVKATAIATVQSGSANSTTEVVQNMAAPLTTLHVAGVVRNALGTSLSGVTVNLTATYNTSIATTLTTDANGFYTADFSFGSDTPDQVGLSFRVSKNGIGTAKTQQVNLVSGVVTNQNNDLILDSNTPGTSRWNYATNGAVRSVALADDGTVILGTVGSSGGAVVALNPDGTTRWTFSTGGLAPAVSIASDGTIYVGSGDYYSGHLYALTATGAQKWVFTTARYLSIPTLSEDGVVYAAGEDGTLYAVNSSNGQQLWAWSNHNVRNDQPITVSQDGTVLVTVGYNNNLQAINPDGTPRWMVSNAGGSVAIGADGTIYAGSSSLYALKLDGTTKWTAEGGNAVVGSDGTIYVTTLVGLIAYNPAGGMLWRNGQSNGGFVSIGADGLLYVSSNNSALYAFDADGNEQWRFSGQGYGVWSPPAIASNGTIYVGTQTNTNTGQLYAISSSSLGLANSAWARSGKDNHNTSRAPFVAVPHRTLRFMGKVSNLNQPGSSLENYEVKISNANGSQLCSTTSDVTGAYVCSTPTTDLDGFAVQYDISGAYGTFADTANVSTGFSDSNLDVARDLKLAITTLNVTGRVTNGLGSGIPNAKVTINGDTKIADTNGDYTYFLTLDSATTDFNLTIIAQDEFNSSSTSVDLTLTPGLRNSKTVYLDIDARIPGNVRWRTNITQSSANLLALATDGTVYMAVNEKFLALNPDGSSKWEINTPGSFVQQASIDSDGVIYVVDGRQLVALTSNGTRKWVFDPGNYGANTAPSIGVDGTLYLSVGQSLYALNSDGTVKWSILTTDRDGYGRVVIGSNADLYVKTGENLYAIKQVNGGQDWVLPLMGSKTLALASNGTIYASQYNDLVAVMPNGTIKWTFVNTESGSVDGQVVGEDGTIYFAAYAQGFAINPDGSLKWKAPFENSGYAQGAPIVGRDGKVYFQTEYAEGSGANISAYNTDGQLSWTHQFQHSEHFMLGSNGILYTTVSDYWNSTNYLYGISTSSLGLANSSWSTKNGNAQATGRLP